MVVISILFAVDRPNPEETLNGCTESLCVLREVLMSTAPDLLLDMDAEGIATTIITMMTTMTMTTVITTMTITMTMTMTMT